ncbi:sensor histidine kinase [Segnochrobactrum spirostomi]|uniref:Blue-light-activated histidine kinase n=1 Tax=Segnochrobactrum spirostomi TaxID=2608987 RepID=A0A6A7Y1H4_9HYPH|nr:PAS domain-containing sensor histidine kinase [Segnochrobactrum spirostomi]MQT11961.1 PAS domain-containing protein [Segnochrobactrum spirostomi]
MIEGTPPHALERETDLHRRLAEAEETLRAIREGEVDALVMRGSQADEVFALGGQDSYRAFMQAMDIGAAALDADGKLIYANAALSSLLGRGATDLHGDGFFDALGATPARIVRELSGEAEHDRRSRQIVLPCAGGISHVEVSVSPLPLGFGRGRAVTFTNVTERIEAAAAHESERIGRAIMASSNEAVVVCNGDGIITHANAGVRHFGESRVVGRRFDEAFPLNFSLSAGLMTAGDLVGVALAGTAVRGVEATLSQESRTRDLLLSAGPLRQSGDTIGGCIVTLADITERKASEKRQALLMGELTHRVKNTLTLVMSIANRTLASIRDMSEFRTAFGRRLEALAATHTLLAEGAWAGLTLEDLVNAELAPYAALGSPRFALRGLNVRIASDTAVALGLIFHELVTNAVKYGALSNDTGRISIAAAPDGDSLELVWREEGGPPVTAPEKAGFGQTVISRGLGQSGAKATKVEFHPEGLVCRMFLAREQLDPA